MLSEPLVRQVRVRSSALSWSALMLLSCLSSVPTLTAQVSRAPAATLTSTVPSTESRGPYYGFVPAACWYGQEWTLIQNAWPTIDDTIVVKREGIPILAGFADYTPAAWRKRGTVADSLRVCDAAVTAPAERWRGLHVLDAARIKVTLGQDSAAWALTQQYLAEVGTRAPARPYMADRSWALYLAAQVYLDVLPVRWTAAERLVAALDRLPDAPLNTRWLAHEALFVAASAVEANDAKALEAARSLYDLWRRHKTEIEEGYADDLGYVITTRADVVMRQQGLTAARAVID